MGLQALKPDAKCKQLGNRVDFFVMQVLKKVNREKELHKTVCLL